MQEALDRFMFRGTTLEITHRLSTIRKADLVVVLHQGSLSEMGSYDQLIAKGDNSLYANSSACRRWLMKQLSTMQERVALGPQMPGTLSDHQSSAATHPMAVRRTHIAFPTSPPPTSASPSMPVYSKLPSE